jgi:hypothetical protein
MTNDAVLGVFWGGCGGQDIVDICSEIKMAVQDSQGTVEWSSRRISEAR